MTYPYSDEYLVYDYTKHQYRLTPKAVLDKLNEDLTRYSPATSINRQRDAEIMLENISDEVYNQIYEMSSDYLIPEYILAKCPSARPIIQQVLIEQVKYFMFNGSISVYSGVDFKKGTVGTSANDRILCTNAKRILNREIRETGMPLTYCGNYITFHDFGNYEKDSY